MTEIQRVDVIGSELIITLADGREACIPEATLMESIEHSNGFARMQHLVEAFDSELVSPLNLQGTP